MRIAPAFAALLAIGFPLIFDGPGAPLVAQSLPVLDPGVPVRVEAPGLERRRVSGTVQTMDRDHLVLALAGDPVRSVTVPVAAVTRIDVGRPRSRSEGAMRGFGRGALIGTGIGLGLGVLAVVADGGIDALAAAGYGITTFDIYGGPTATEALAIFGVAGGITGAGLGGLLGVVRPGLAWDNRWRAPDLSVSPAVYGGFAVRYAVRF